MTAVVECIQEGIYRLRIPLPGNPLKELNSYWITSGEEELLIDTGFCQPACREALSAALERLGSRPERRDVLLTHLHADHSGLAREFAGSRRRIYINRIDLNCLNQFIQGNGYAIYHQRYVQEGLPNEVASCVERDNPVSAAPETVDSRFTPLEDGQSIRVGAFELKLLLVPGHTPGNAIIWMQQEGILFTGFTGDHVLFGITPNITAWPGTVDSLGDYLDSLHRYQNLPVRRALPAHRGEGGYRERVDQLSQHHFARLNEVLSILESEPGLSAEQVAARMTWGIQADSWDTFPDVQKWFAVGECLAHLDYLFQRGHVTRTLRQEVRRYECVSPVQWKRKDY